MSIGERLFAWMYHRFDDNETYREDAVTRQIHTPLIAQARGEVLEIGAGDGFNLPLYPPDVGLTLLEPNGYSLDYLREEAEELGTLNYRTEEGVAERLPYADGSFDTVVSTYVLCSVQDQAQALAEVRRVLRPGGRFLFVEHVAAPPGTGTHRAQRLVNPVWRAMSGGCNLTRNTGAAIQAAGFKQVEINTHQADGGMIGTRIYGWAEA